jgi:uncharacterized RDD family membrane protein YckC
MTKSAATLLDRTKSSTIDTLFLITLAFVVAGILNNFENVPTWVRALLFTSLIMYEPICITFGATIGNHVMNIRIRRSSNESKKLNILRSVTRFVSKLIFGWISYITIFKNPRKRAIHDLITGATTIEV